MDSPRSRPRRCGRSSSATSTNRRRDRWPVQHRGERPQRDGGWLRQRDRRGCRGGDHVRDDRDDRSRRVVRPRYLDGRDHARRFSRLRSGLVLRLEITVYDGGFNQTPPVHTVVINVTNVNEAPTATGGSFSLLETAQPNPPVVLFDVDGTDPDAGQSLTYSIVGGNTNSQFTIVPSTGQIFLAATSATRRRRSTTCRSASPTTAIPRCSRP